MTVMHRNVCIMCSDNCQFSADVFTFCIGKVLLQNQVMSVYWEVQSSCMVHIHVVYIQCIVLYKCGYIITVFNCMCALLLSVCVSNVITFSICVSKL